MRDCSTSPTPCEVFCETCEQHIYNITDTALSSREPYYIRRCERCSPPGTRPDLRVIDTDIDLSVKLDVA